MPLQIISGNKLIENTVHFSQDTVMKSRFTVRMCIDDLFCTKFLCYTGKTAFFLQNIRGRIMEKHNELPITVSPRLFKRDPQPPQLTFDQFSGVGFFFFIPANDLPSRIQIERTFKSEAFRSDQCIVFIGEIIVLKKTERA